MKKILKKIIVLILTLEAQLVLKKYKPKIIAISGSVGKTSTKDAIFTVLADTAYTRKSQKSFNSDIGIPLTILGSLNGWNNPILWMRTIIEGLILIILPSIYPKLLILEIGADRPGDIRNVVRWLKPNTSVITKLSKVPVHVEFFASPEEVKAEKGNLASVLESDGTLILNADDSDVMSFSKLTSARTISYGFTQGADVQATNYKIIYETRDKYNFPVGISYTVVSKVSGTRNDINTKPDETAEISIFGSVGKQNVYITLAAICVGISEGNNLNLIADALKKHETPPGRMKIIEGIKQSVIIDDSYNSSPIAQKEALETLSELETGGRKIAILGDMLELGSFSAEEHKIVGVKAAETCAMLITVGPRARSMRDSAIGAGMDSKSAISFDDSRKAGEYVSGVVGTGDVILVKGSQGNIRMERAVEMLMAYKERKTELLVRQEPEWQNR